MVTGESRTIGFFGDGDGVQIKIFESDMEGAVESDFNEDGMSGADADDLILEKLEEFVFEAECEVVGDNAGGPHGEDLVEVLGFQEGPVGVGWTGWFDGATAVVIGDVNVAEETVRFLDGRDGCQAELFDEPILMGEESPLDTPLGLWRMGANDLNVEVIHGAGELGDGGIIPKFFFNSGLSVDLVDGIFIDVEGDGTSVKAEIVAGGGHEVQGVFDRDEAGEENFAGGIVNEDQQDASRAAPFEPVVVGTVKLDELADGRPALAPGSVFGRRPPGFVEPLFDHSLTNDRDGQAQAMDFQELFFGEGGSKIGVSDFDDVQGLIEKVWIQLMIGGLPPKPVYDALGAVLADAGAKTPDLSFG